MSGEYDGRLAQASLSACGTSAGPSGVCSHPVSVTQLRLCGRGSIKSEEEEGVGGLPEYSTPQCGLVKGEALAPQLFLRFDVMRASPSKVRAREEPTNPAVSRSVS